MLRTLALKKAMGSCPYRLKHVGLVNAVICLDCFLCIVLVCLRERTNYIRVFRLLILLPLVFNSHIFWFLHCTRSHLYHLFMGTLAIDGATQLSKGDGWVSLIKRHTTPFLDDQMRTLDLHTYLMGIQHISVRVLPTISVGPSTGLSWHTFWYRDLCSSISA